MTRLGEVALGWRWGGAGVALGWRWGGAGVALGWRDHGLRLGLGYVGSQLLLVGKCYPFVHMLAETLELIAEIGTGNVRRVPRFAALVDSGRYGGKFASAEECRCGKRGFEGRARGGNEGVAAGERAQTAGGDGRDRPCGIYQCAGDAELNGPVRVEHFKAAVNALENEDAGAAAMRKAV